MASERKTLTALLVLAVGLVATKAPAADVRGWLDWRGPAQNGTSLEKGLPDTWALGGTNDLW